MAPEIHNVDDLFRERLFEYDPPAPEDVWLKINDANQKRKKLILWVTLSSLAASIAILISLGIGYYFGSTYTKKQLSSNSVKKVKANVLSNSEKPNSNKGKQEITGTKNKQYHAVRIASNSTLNRENASSKEIGNIPYIYIKEKMPLLTEIKTGINKLPDLKSSKLIVSKEVHANYFENYNSNETYAEKPKNHNKNWEIGAEVAPLYSKWSVQNNNYYTNDYVNSVETPVMAYLGGLNVCFNSSRWKFEAGISYMWGNQDLSNVSKNMNVSKTNAQISNSLDVNDPVRNYNIYHMGGNKNASTSGLPNNVVNNTSTIYSITSKKKANTTYLIANNYKSIESPLKSSGVKSSMNQTFDYIVVPFIAYYKVIDRMADLSLCGGISTNILVDSKRYIEIEDETFTLGQIETLKRFGYSGIIGINLEVPLLTSIRLKLEPSLNYNLNSIEKSSSVNIYPYAFGIYTGISFAF